jgi:hypothetical protein
MKYLILLLLVTVLGCAEPVKVGDCAFFSKDGEEYSGTGYAIRYKENYYKLVDEVIVLSVGKNFYEVCFIYKKGNLKDRVCAGSYIIRKDRISSNDKFDCPKIEILE